MNKAYFCFDISFVFFSTGRTTIVMQLTGAVVQFPVLTFLLNCVVINSNISAACQSSSKR